MWCVDVQCGVDVGLAFSHSRPLAFSSSSSCPLRFSSLISFSRSLEFSSSRPLLVFILSSSHPIVLSSSLPLLVLSNSRSLVLSSSRSVVLSHSRPPLPLESKERRGSTQEDLAYILGHWRTSRSVHTLGGELPLVLDCKVLC
jgi:hypothetical protein